MAAAQGSGSAALLVLALVAALACSALAATIPITWNQGTDYTNWASTNNVKKGDTLVFNFDSSHSALVVSEADYNSCTANPTQTLQSGKGVVVNNDIYVICGTPGHCSPNGGMKLAVKLSSAPATPTTPATPSTPTTPTTPGGTTPSTPTENTPAGSAASGLQAGTALVVVSMALAPLLL